MAHSKKFGTLSGVFTPSILTILGVIMYLRFPAIIGQAGLINTIGIIVIAHIISITTSLSVASLSTDKPVQNGGTYFMISRSLGLPIGGTLGLALFVGLSFSVSLYLIGFAESFLQYWNLDNSINTVRITGTIVLIAVTTITFISTSLAIKSQYFIMAAIGLSLLSIFFGHHDLAPDHVNMAPLATAAPFMVLFGIFFPAVTGFEAGVSMSGDLKNPRKSLPIGAISAVGVGFIVYIGLAIFYAFTVDANALVNDPQILFKISLVPALVIAGIWGATLSSALGSILGAPRILQAIAMDKIAPKIFAKGTGKTNEPRNALTLAFLIAEAGILIGELDVIARIVSMFFITTYAFLNLASAIESWSSSDFRPAFRIPRFVSILGTLSAFFVMILLDFLALAGATVVLGLLYFFLQRKELILENGDAWSSFWTNLAKRSLLKLSIQKTNKRNWRPNIILFSGGEQARPHLVEMGLSLSGKLGALTDFELVINSDTERGILTNVKAEKKKQANYFKREFSCNSIDDGIQNITSVYGFSGFEPNTILMGWSKVSKNTESIAKLLTDFRKKNFNAVFLDYDKQNGFGKKEHIDIWWNGKGRHLSFSLGIIKFLQSDTSWRDAEVRILIIDNDSSITDRIYRNTSSLLTEKRISAEIKIINDDFGTRSKESIIHSESANADLILVGLSQKYETYTSKYISSVNHIAEIAASVLFLYPSDEFEEINLVDSPIKKEETRLHTRSQNIELKPIPAIENKVLKGRLEKADEECLAIIHDFFEKAIHETIAAQKKPLQILKEFTTQNLKTFSKEVSRQNSHESIKALNRNHQNYLRNINSFIKKQNTEINKEIEDALREGISEFLTRLGNFIYESPEVLLVPYIIQPKGKEKNIKIGYQKLLSYYLHQSLVPEIENQLKNLEEISIHLFTGLRNIIFGVHDIYEKLGLNPETDFTASINMTSNEFNALEDYLEDFASQSRNTLFELNRNLTIQIVDDLSSPAQLKKAGKKTKSRLKPSMEYLDTYADNWSNGIKLINNTLQLDTLILLEQKVTRGIIQSSNEKTRALVTEKILSHIDKLLKNIGKAGKSSPPEIKAITFPDEIQIKKIFQDAYSRISDNIEDLPEEIQLPESIYKEDELVPLNDYEVLNSSLERIARYYFDTLFYEPFYRENEQLEATLSNTITECNEVNNLLLFKLNNIQDELGNTAFAQGTETDFFTKLSNQTKKEKEKVEAALLTMERNSDIFIKNTFSRLFYHALPESEKTISSQQREQKSKKLSAGIQRKTKNIKSKLNSFFVAVLNSTSSGIILSKKYLSSDKETRTQIGQILELVSALLPDKRIYNYVPVFYRALFSSSSKINDEFWITREKEMESVKSALQHHKNGLGGAVLIKGLHGAGKTTLSRYVANHLFKKSNIFWVTPPLNGSAQVPDLLTAFRKVVGSNDDFDEIFNKLPYESIVIINDLELWWERSNNGYQVLEKLIELIHNFGKKVFFVLNCNIYSFNIINSAFPMEDAFLSIIDCENFNTYQLQNLILKRHKSSGIKLQYKDHDEEDLSQLSLSILFNTYFNLCQGNPGIAINTWKANIIKADSESVRIKKPKPNDSDILNYLDPDWLVVIALFIQHKNLDVIKLARILKSDAFSAEKIINNLFNSGLIVQKGSNAYTLGRNIEPYLVDVCAKKGII
jgi:amino acid transporter